MEQEFTEFREYDKSLKHEIGRFCLSCVSCWHCGGILVYYTRGGWVAGSSPITVMTNIFVTEFSECNTSFKNSRPLFFEEFLIF